jgi:MSHA pilin protein MshC
MKWIEVPLAPRAAFGGGESRLDKVTTMKQQGFSLVELIAVMVILGVLAVAALPRMADRSDFDSRSFHDETLAALRYAQKAAVSQRRNVCVAFGVNTVTLTVASAPGSGSPCNTNLTGPTGAAPYQVPPVGRTPQASFDQAPVLPVTVPANFQFDALGRPNASQTIKVVGSSRNITIEAETGYVYSS